MKGERFRSQTKGLIQDDQNIFCPVMDSFANRNRASECSVHIILPIYEYRLVITSGNCHTSFGDGNNVVGVVNAHENAMPVFNSYESGEDMGTSPSYFWNIQSFYATNSIFNQVINVDHFIEPPSANEF